MKKVCTLCKKEQDLSAFTKDKTTADGYYGSCRVCKREISRQRYDDKHRAAAIARTRAHHIANTALLRQVKSHFGCIVCSENSHPSILELHHLDADTKELTLADVRTINKQRFIDEICKCVCLCSNCHKKVHLSLIDSSLMKPITLQDIEDAQNNNGEM